MPISPPNRTIVRLTRRDFYIVDPVSLSLLRRATRARPPRAVASRRGIGGCAQNAPSPRHSTRKENRSLPLHNCILRNVTVIVPAGIIDLSRSGHPRKSRGSLAFRSIRPLVRSEILSAPRGPPRTGVPREPDRESELYLAIDEMLNSIDCVWDSLCKWRASLLSWSFDSCIRRRGGHPADRSRGVRRLERAFDDYTIIAGTVQYEIS